MQWIKLDSVDSSNSYVSELLKHGKAAGELVILTDYQETGKGQGSNHWHSQKGENLLMSILLFPAFLSASQQFHLSGMASLAICDLLDPMGLDPSIKWPNDILTPGGKIAGILIEHGITGHHIAHTIIGIGLNLNQAEFPAFPVRATSLLREKGITLEPQFAAEGLVEHLKERYERLRKGSTELQEKEYLDRLFGLDQEAEYVAGGKTFTGIIRGVNEFGELIVESKGETKTYGFQEIKLKVKS